MNSNHMTDAEYHAHPAMNYSRLKHLRDSPAHFRNACDNPKPPSTSMSFGSLVHCLVLEPDQFGQRYEVTTETNKRLKAYKVAKADAEERGLELVTDLDLSNAHRAAGNVLAHPWVQELIADPRTLVEHMHFWEHDELGPCRMKVDLARLVPNGLMGCDLKTTKSTNPYSFKRDARMYGYALQAAHYLYGLADLFGVQFGNVALDWRIIAVESVAPFDVTVFELSDETIEEAMQEHDTLARLHRICVEDNHWPGRNPHAELDLTWRA